MPPQQQQQQLEEPLLAEDPEEEFGDEGSNASLPPTPSTSTHSTQKKRNIHLTLIYTAIYFAGRAIWNQSVLATLVYFIKNQNAQAVGYITAVMGLSQLIASVPSGYCADRHRRDTLLRVASGVGVAAIMGTCYACLQKDYRTLVVALALWGLYNGVANTSLMALFADSIPDGERSHYFTQRSMLVTLGNLAGPLSALVMFRILGNQWTADDCAKVMAFGQIVCFPAIILLCFFRDDDGDDSSGSDLVEDQEQGEEEAEQTSPLVTSANSSSTSSEDEDYDEGENGESTRQQIELPCGGCCLPKNRAIPILIAISDVIAGLGAGLSIRYFPLFFVDNLGLSPVQVQIVYAVTNLVKVPLMKIAQRLSKRFGRCHVTLALRSIGIICMGVMILLYVIRSDWKVAICTVFILRTSFMNSVSALTRSMLMDHVPSHERAKWSALESINTFSWSGSAAVGGVLVGFFGLIPLFSITAVVQLASSSILLLLFRVDTQESTMFQPSTSPEARREASR